MLKAFKRLAITLISLLAIYSWLGFLLVPSIALKATNDQLDIYANSPANLQRLEFNPFTFELNAWGFHIGEADNQQISLQQLYGKLSPGSLRNKTVHLQDVQLTKPVGQVIFNKQGQLNLAQLFNLPDAQKKLDDDTSPTFAVLIDKLQLQQGNLRFNDQRQQDEVDVTLADLNITLNNFDTRPASNSELQLSAQASDGTQLQWQGNISISPLASQGHMQLQDAQLKSWWPYVREHFTAQLKDGKLNLDTHYELELTPKYYRNGYYKGISGDLFLELQPGWQVIEQGDVDNERVRNNAITAPVIFFGKDIKPQKINRTIEVTEIAPSVSYRLRIRAPNAAEGDILKELF